MRALILAEPETALTRVCGISLLERLLRTLQQAGFRHATVLASRPEPLETHLARPSWARGAVTVSVRRRPAGPVTVGQVLEAGRSADGPEPVLLLSAGAVYDLRLIQELAARTRPSALVDSAPPDALAPLVSRSLETSDGLLCGAAVVDAEWARARSGHLDEALREGLEEGSLVPVDVAGVASYIPGMRRAIRPLWFPAPGPSGRRRATRLLLDSAQKGVLDLPARVHGPIETFFVSFLCRTPLTPNHLTVIAILVASTATGLFATGHLGWGVSLALAVGVLDGLDGKQARVKIEMSKVGELEHWSDFLYELSWWTALAYHFHASGEVPRAFLLLFLLYLAEGLDGLMKLAVKRRLGRSIDDLGAYSRLVRLMGGRRNVYTWIMAAGVLLGAPAAAFVLLPRWEAATALLHIPCLLWAFGRRPLAVSPAAVVSGPQES